LIDRVPAIWHGGWGNHPQWKKALSSRRERERKGTIIEEELEAIAKE
jgi:hypothetical protein